MREFTEGQFWEAAKPLFDLLGTTPMHVYDDTLRFGHDGEGRLVVSFRKVVDPDTPREGWPVVAHGDDPATAEWAYEVNVAALPAGDVRDVWPGDRPDGSRAYESA